MNLDKVLPNAGKGIEKLFWTLIIDDDWIQSGIWHVFDKKVNVLFSSSSLAWKTDEELVASVDGVLSSGVEYIPDGTQEPVDTVFGLPSTWVVEGSIKEGYLEKIRIICEKLSLKPAGFVVVGEAVAHFLKSKDEPSLSANIIYIGSHSIEISTYVGGQNVKTETVVRSLSIAEDLREAFSRFEDVDSIPSKFIIYDGKSEDLEGFRQEITGVDWVEIFKDKMLYEPKVEIISPEEKIMAVSLAGGVEIAGAEKVVPVDSEKTETEEVENIKIVDPSAIGFGEVPVTKPKFHFKSNFLKLPKMKIGGVGVLHKGIIVSLVSIVLVFLGFLLFWFSSARADVTVYLVPKNIEESTPVTVSLQEGDKKLEEKRLSGKTVKVSEEGTRTKAVSGTKIVGDKAKGEVTIFGTIAEVKFEKGIIVSSSGGMNFVLEADIVLPSGSASSPGTAKATVIAEKIGTEYNLASGTVFKIENYPQSDVEAKNETGFSGGTSREVSAVSEGDYKEIEERLKNELIEKGKDGIRNRTDSQSDISLEEPVVLNETKKEYSKKIGDEANEITLNMGLDLEFLTVSKSDLLEMASGILKSKIYASYVLREEQIDTRLSFKETKDGKYLVDAVFSANLLPKVDIAEIRKKISGKRIAAAKNYLNEVKGFSRADIFLKPRLIRFVRILPPVPKNISITLDAE